VKCTENSKGLLNSIAMVLLLVYPGEY